MFSAAEVEGLSFNYEISSNTEFSLGSNELVRFLTITFLISLRTIDHLTVK